MSDLNDAALVQLVESNWSEFVELCQGDEEDAERTLQQLKVRAGME